MEEDDEDQEARDAAFAQLDPPRDEGAFWAFANAYYRHPAVDERPTGATVYCLFRQPRAGLTEAGFSYVGFSTRPFYRLYQHWRLRPGGAKTTARDRRASAWFPAAHVSGLHAGDDDASRKRGLHRGLLLESLWKQQVHEPKGTQIRALLQRENRGQPFYGPKKAYRNYARFLDFECACHRAYERLHWLALLLTHPLWRRCQLRVTFFAPQFAQCYLRAEEHVRAQLAKLIHPWGVPRNQLAPRPALVLVHSYVPDDDAAPAAAAP